MAKPRRVIVLGTGTVGTPGLRAVIEHPELELVGVHAWSPTKVGRDAGDLVGVAPTGVVATNDMDALLALEADCLAHFGNGALREAECNAEMIPFLECGTNVVTAAQMDVFMPRYGRPEFVEPIAEACRRGGSSIFSSGVEPGYCTTGFALSLLSAAGRVDAVHLAEVSDVSSYQGVASLRLYGLGEPLDHEPPMFTDRVGEAWHKSTVLSMAEYLGIAVDDVTSVWDTAALDFPIVNETGFGRIEAGLTVAARWTITALSGGKPVIVWEKIERLHPAAGPDWRQPKVGAGEASWQVEIDGFPAITSEINVDLLSGCAMIALHPINAIPAVCAAPPGIVDPMTLPPFWSATLDPAIRRAGERVPA